MLIRGYAILLVSIVSLALVVLGIAAAEAKAVTLYGASSGTNSSLYTIDSTTGAATLVGAIGFSSVDAMEVDLQTGVIYVAGYRPSDGVHVLITVDPVTGAGTEVGPTGVEVTLCNEEWRVTSVRVRSFDPERKPALRSTSQGQNP